MIYYAQKYEFSLFNPNTLKQTYEIVFMKLTNDHLRFSECDFVLTYIFL